ncbi:hypothetical protein LINGRAHAP2_LOCUS15858 [Linum grandiflorum]
MFHGECTITLQDVGNLTGLAVMGDAVYTEYDNKGMDWAALVQEVLGKTTDSGYVKDDGGLKMS